MRDLSKRRQRLCLLLAGLVLLCLLPACTGVREPARDPYWKEITVSSTLNVASIDVYVDGPDGAFYPLETFQSQYESRQKIGFLRPEDATKFYLKVTMTDGTVRISPSADAAGMDQQFSYVVKSNALISMPDLSSLGFWGLLLLLLFLFVLMLAVTVLLECLVALLFRLKPLKHVIVINCITTLLMPFVRVLGSYRTLIFLNVILVIVEYLYYAKKYPDRKKWQLFVFSLLANVLSLGILGGLV